MNILIQHHNKKINARLSVPASKSISNRLLIIQALANNGFEIQNLSDSDDTIVLENALKSEDTLIDIGLAGTAMRFATAFFANHNTTKVITGTERMKNRPIANLVNALRSIGADIDYTEREGYPPLTINGQNLKGGAVSIDGSVSSQFISALLMIAPTFENGLILTLENNVISSSYIKMTIDIMKIMGVDVITNTNTLTVKKQEYKGKDIIVEGDWSGVSYIYEIVALSENAEISIETLHKESLQGDAKVAEIFEQLGVHTEYLANEIRLRKTQNKTNKLTFNFIENPDLVQTVAVTCVMLKIPFYFEGTQSLRIKETDRITALQNELGKFGAKLEYTDNGVLQWDGKISGDIEDKIQIPTYHDHRMAMAFAPIALTNKKIIIEHPQVVGKSYPRYWDDLKTMGFEINNL